MDSESEQGGSVAVDVVILRDGVVLSARVVESNGADRLVSSVVSVFDALEAVRPIPSTCKLEQLEMRLVFASPATSDSVQGISGEAQVR